MNVRWMAPVGVVDEKDATGFEFWQSGTSAHRAIPAVHDDQIKRSVWHILDGGDVGWQWVIFVSIGVRLGVLQGDVLQIDVTVSGICQLASHLSEPSGIALNADEVMESFG